MSFQERYLWILEASIRNVGVVLKCFEVTQVIEIDVRRVASETIDADLYGWDRATGAAVEGYEDAIHNMKTNQNVETGGDHLGNFHLSLSDDEENELPYAVDIFYANKDKIDIFLNLSEQLQVSYVLNLTGLASGLGRVMISHICATNSSEANGIIRNPKLELESFCFTFDLVPLSYGKRLYCLVGRKFNLGKENVVVDRGVGKGVKTKNVFWIGRYVDQVDREKDVVRLGYGRSLGLQGLEATGAAVKDTKMRTSTTFENKPNVEKLEGVLLVARHNGWLVCYLVIVLLVRDQDLGRSIDIAIVSMVFEFSLI
ncbi:hypothetical protein Tco_0413386 [Tanacetum coccineum]